MEKKEIIFVDGISAFAPFSSSPSFVKLDLYLNPEKLNKFMAEHYDKVSPKGFLKCTVKESKAGNYYIDLDTYKKPEAKTDPENHNDNWGTLKSPNANMDNFDGQVIDETKIPF